jgi:Universal stress protein family.
LSHSHSGPVVVGYDGKEPAQRALARAVEEAKTRGVQLVVVAVEELPLDPQGPQNYGSLDDEPMRMMPIEAPDDLQDLFAGARRRSTRRRLRRLPLGGRRPGPRDRGCRPRPEGVGRRSRRAPPPVHGPVLGTDVPAEVERELGADVIRVE